VAIQGRPAECSERYVSGVGAFQIVSLARRQDEIQRIAQRIDKQDFRPFQ
jgi:hypothetical protein